MQSFPISWWNKNWVFLYLEESRLTIQALAFRRIKFKVILPSNKNTSDILIRFRTHNLCFLQFWDEILLENIFISTDETGAQTTEKLKGEPCDVI